MRVNYDFSNAKRNPYAKRLKKQLTIRIDAETIGYFQELSRELAVPYQTLINMYLRDCAVAKRRPEWASRGSAEGAKKPSRRTGASGAGR